MTRSSTNIPNYWGWRFNWSCPGRITLWQIKYVPHINIKWNMINNFRIYSIKFFAVYCNNCLMVRKLLWGINPTNAHSVRFPCIYNTIYSICIILDSAENMNIFMLQRQCANNCLQINQLINTENKKEVWIYKSVKA